MSHLRFRNIRHIFPPDALAGVPTKKSASQLGRQGYGGEKN